MSDDLRRVGLVFKEDGAVDFKKSLQEINLELNKNYNQFKLTQAQWDKSTKSTQKLRAEQEYLKNAYEIQQDKVSTLKMQLSDLENAENKNTTAIKKKRNELTNAEIKLENYKNKIQDIEYQLNNTGKKIEEFGAKTEKVGNKIEGAGKKLSAFSVAVGSAFVASAKNAIDFEEAFTGVEKTVDGTEQQMAELKQGIRDMAKEIPSSTTEISAVAEAAGQLGIKTDDVLSFTRTMIDMGNATNLSADEAATTLARFANVTKMSQKDFGRLGSVIVALGNNFATTEAEISAMGMNLASAGTQVGMSQSQIMALATALSSVGLEAQAGGTAFSKVMVNMQLAVEKGGKDLKNFASVAGMSTKEFKRAFKEDATSAIMQFIDGLSKSGERGKSAIKVLDDMGITETRLRDALLRSANASEVMAKAVKLGNDAWEDNTALTNEANKRYETVSSQIKIAINKIKDLAVTFGNKMLPAIKQGTKYIENLTEKVGKLDDNQIRWILNIGKAVVAIGPLLMVLGKITTTAGTAIKTIGTFTQAIGVARGTITSTSTAVNMMAKVIGGLTGPVGIACTAFGALAAVYVAHEVAMKKEKASLGGLKEEVENQRKSWEDLGKSRQDSLSGTLSEIEMNEKLFNELKQITDENGRVKEGYEKRAEIILSKLNGALGTEYQLNGNIIAQYGELKSNIEKVIAAKKAEAVLNAYQEEYGMAIKEQAKATQDLIELKKKQKEAAEQMHSANAKERNEASLLYASIGHQIGEQTKLIGEYGKTIQDYESLQKANIEGTAEEISKAITEIGVSYDKGKEQAEESIEAQIIAQGKYVEILKESLSEARKNNDEYQAHVLESQLSTSQQQLGNLANSLLQQTSTIEELTPEQLKAWKYVAEQSRVEYDNALSNLPEDTRKRIESATGIVAMNFDLPNAMGDLGNQGTMRFSERFKLEQEARQEINASSSTINSDTSVPDAAGNLADRAENAVANNNSNSWGQDMVEGLGNGIQSKGNSSWFTGILSGLAGKIASFLHFSRPDQGPLREYEKWMPDMVEGLGKSLDKASPNLINKVKDMSEEMSSELQNVNGNINANNNSKQNFESQKFFNIEMDYDKMAKAFLLALNSSEAITMLNMILEKKSNTKLVLDTGVLVGETKDAFDTELANNQTRRKRGN